MTCGTGARCAGRGSNRRRPRRRRRPASTQPVAVHLRSRSARSLALLRLRGMAPALRGRRQVRAGPTTMPTATFPMAGTAPASLRAEDAGAGSHAPLSGRSEGRRGCAPGRGSSRASKPCGPSWAARSLWSGSCQAGRQSGSPPHEPARAAAAAAEAPAPDRPPRRIAGAALDTPPPASAGGLVWLSESAGRQNARPSVNQSPDQPRKVLPRAPRSSTLPARPSRRAHALRPRRTGGLHAGGRRGHPEGDGGRSPPRHRAGGRGRPAPAPRLVVRYRPATDPIAWYRADGLRHGNRVRRAGGTETALSRC